MNRKTEEVKIKIDFAEDIEIDTGERILDHMLDTLFFYMNLPVNLDATWDLEHHLWEDTGIIIGKFLKEKIKGKNIARFGEAVIPMDDALVLTAIDISRPYLKFPSMKSSEGFQPGLVKEFLLALSRHLEATVHFLKLNGENTHHVIEACFKGLGVCLKEAMKEENETKSTKGILK